MVLLPPTNLCILIIYVCFSALHHAVEGQVTGHSEAKVEDGNILVSSDFD